MIDLTKIGNNALLVLESAGWFSERLISTNSRSDWTAGRHQSPAVRAEFGGMG